MTSDKISKKIDQLVSSVMMVKEIETHLSRTFFVQNRLMLQTYRDESGKAFPKELVRSIFYFNKNKSRRLNRFIMELVCWSPSAPVL